MAIPAWPSTLNRPQLLAQAVKKNPKTLQSDAGAPTLSRLVNPLATSASTLLFFCTHCEMQQIFVYWQSVLAGGLRAVTMELKTENGFSNETIFLTLSSGKMISEQKAEMTFAIEIKHKVIV